MTIVEPVTLSSPTPTDMTSPTSSSEPTFPLYPRVPNYCLHNAYDHYKCVTGGCETDDLGCAYNTYLAKTKRTRCRSVFRRNHCPVEDICAKTDITCLRPCGFVQEFGIFYLGTTIYRYNKACAGYPGNCTRQAEKCPAPPAGFRFPECILRRRMYSEMARNMNMTAGGEPASERACFDGCRADDACLAATHRQNGCFHHTPFNDMNRITEANGSTLYVKSCNTDVREKGPGVCGDEKLYCEKENVCVTEERWCKPCESSSGCRRCPDTGKCVCVSDVCDGYKDCPGGWDEAGCPTRPPISADESDGSGIVQGVIGIVLFAFFIAVCGYVCVRSCKHCRKKHRSPESGSGTTETARAERAPGEMTSLAMDALGRPGLPRRAGRPPQTEDPAAARTRQLERELDRLIHDIPDEFSPIRHNIVNDVERRPREAPDPYASPAYPGPPSAPSRTAPSRTAPTSTAHPPPTITAYPDATDLTPTAADPPPYPGPPPAPTGASSARPEEPPPSYAEVMHITARAGRPPVYTGIGDQGRNTSDA